jgi:hypothetical protein
MSGGGVRRIEVTERESPVFGGTEFGAVGSMSACTAPYSANSIRDIPLNAGIINVDRAVRNSRGKLEYRSEFRISKPLELDRGRAQPRQPADDVAAQWSAGRQASPACRERLSDAVWLHAGVEESCLYIVGPRHRRDDAPRPRVAGSRRPLNGSLHAFSRSMAYLAYPPRCCSNPAASPVTIGCEPVRDRRLPPAYIGGPTGSSFVSARHYSTAAIISISTIASGWARPLIWIVVLVGLPTPKYRMRTSEHCENAW